MGLVVFLTTWAAGGLPVVFVRALVLAVARVVMRGLASAAGAVRVLVAGVLGATVTRVLVCALVVGVTRVFGLAGGVGVVRVVALGWVAGVALVTRVVLVMGVCLLNNN